MLQYLKKLGISSLNQMQVTAIATINSHQNALLLAPTGSGKTIAFLMPLFNIIKPERRGIQALVLVPTRELALQIASVWRSMSSGITISAFYGGHSFETEINALNNPSSILVATPGRLADHFSRKTLDYSKIKTIVYDEFDKSLEMGFQDQMAYILDHLKDIDKQVFVSATKGIALPSFLKVNKLEEIDFISKTKKNDLQYFIIKAADKEKSLVNLLAQIPVESTMIFCNQREETETIAKILKTLGINCGVFHGKIEQQDREKALIRFRNESSRFLVCTDLAARGLDIPEVRNVVHFALPHHLEEFTHRNGRTARMGASGSIYILTDESGFLPQYIDVVPEVLDLKASPQSFEEESWVTLYISGGKKDKISKMDIVGFFTKVGHLAKEDIGKIEVQETVSFVAVKKAHTGSLLHKIKDQKIKGKKMKIEVAK